MLVSTQNNKTLVFKPRGLFTPKCRSPPFLFSENQNREMKKEERTMDKREYYLYVKGKAVAVSEEVYRAYWKITEHEKYLQRKGR